MEIEYDNKNNKTRTYWKIIFIGVISGVITLGLTIFTLLLIFNSELKILIWNISTIGSQSIFLISFSCLIIILTIGLVVMNADLSKARNATKAFVFSFLLTSISCYQGYYVKGGSIELGKASTAAVVLSNIMILLTDYVIALLMT